MKMHQQKTEAPNSIEELTVAPQKGTEITAEFLLGELKEKKIGHLPQIDHAPLLEVLPQVPETENQSLSPVPATTTRRTQFNEVYAGDHCKLEVRSARLGREVRLTINAGSTLENAFDEINAKSQERYGRDAIQKNLYFDPKVKDIVNETSVVIFTPVLNHSTNRVKFGNDPKNAHEAFLREKGMDWVDRPYITAAAGAFRVAKGFPEDTSLIASQKDKGDLLKGRIVHGRHDSLVSHSTGVTSYQELYGLNPRNAHHCVAGSFGKTTDFLALMAERPSLRIE